MIDSAILPIVDNKIYAQKTVGYLEDNITKTYAVLNPSKKNFNNKSHEDYHQKHKTVDRDHG